MKRRFLTAAWRNLVMLNYEVDPALLRPLVPRGTELDSFAGRTYLSVVGFQFLGTRVLGVPVPWHRDFPEINLRFYVRRKGPEGWRRGVVFVKEIVPRWAIAAVARWLYNENYVACRMTARAQLPDATRGGAVEYGWRLGPTRNAIRATFTGEPSPLVPGSEEEFITEHYWGYVVQRRGAALEYRVEHPPWRVWRATSASLEADVKVCYGDQFCESLGGTPTSAFVAEGSPIAVYRGDPVSEEVPLAAASAVR